MAILEPCWGLAELVATVISSDVVLFFLNPVVFAEIFFDHSGKDSTGKLANGCQDQDPKYDRIVFDPDQVLGWAK